MALDPDPRPTAVKPPRKRKRRRPPPVVRTSDSAEASRYVRSAAYRKREAGRRRSDSAEAARFTRSDAFRRSRSEAFKRLHESLERLYYAGKLTPEDRLRQRATTARLQRAGATLDPGRAAHNLKRQARDFPSELGAALVHMGRAVGSDVRAEFDPGIPDRGVPGPAWAFGSEAAKAPESRTYSQVAKPMAEGIKYLATRGPVIVRYDKQGRPVYRAKGGGETLDKSKARTGYLAKMEESPLDYLLAASAVPTAGGSAVVAGARLPVVGAKFARHAQPGRRTLKTRTGEEVSTRTSRNPWTRAMQQSRRATTVGATAAVERLIGRELPVVGEHARAVRLGAKQRRRREQADVNRATRPFENTVRRLKRGERIALVLRAQGVTPSQMRRFVDERRAEAQAAAKAAAASGDRVRARELAGQVRDHRRMARLLALTDDDTYRRFDSDPKLQAAYQAADEITERTGDLLEGLELLTPEARALRPYLTARVVGGARWVEPTPGRVGRSPAVDRQRRRVVSLERRYDAAVARREKQRRTTGTPEQIAQVEQRLGRARSEKTKARLREELESLRAPAPALRTSTRGQPAVERIGGALSVAKDDLARAEKAAARRREPTGFVGGPAVEGLARDLHKLIAFPHVGAKLREGQMPQKRSGATPPLKPGITKANKAVRLLASRWLPTPDAWRDSFVRAIGYAHARARGELAYSIAKPLNPDGSKNAGWYYVRLDEPTPQPGARRSRKGQPSRAARERGDLDRELQEFVGGDADLEGYVRARVASRDAEDLERWLDDGGEQVRVGQISPADYRALFGDLMPASKFVRYAFDKPTDFWRTLTLTWRPAWVVNNVVGQTLLYALHHSSAKGAAFYAQSVLDEATRSSRYFPEDLRMGFFESEARQAGGIAAPPMLVRGVNAIETARNAERKMRTNIQRVNAALSDNIPRRAAWYAVADRHRELLDRMEGTTRTLDDFLDELKLWADDPTKADTKLRRLHDDLVQEVLDELIDFQNLSHVERTVLRRVIPFYSFLKGITLTTGRLAFEHPAKVLLLNLLAEQEQQRKQQRFGEGSELLRGLAPVGPGAADRGRGRERDFLSTRGLNPFEAVSDIIEKITGGLEEEPSSPMANPALSVSPIFQALGETAFRRDLFTGQELKAPGGQPTIFAQQLGRSFPQVSVAERVLRPGPAETKAGKPRVTVPGANYPLPGTDRRVPGPLLGYLGLPLTRKNVDRVRAIPEEERRANMTAAQRAYLDVFDNRHEMVGEVRDLAPDYLDEDGRRLRPELREAWNARARYRRAYELYQEKVKGRSLEPIERFRLAAATMVAAGQWSDVKAREEILAHESLPAEVVERHKNFLLREPLGGSKLSHVARLLRRSGGTFELR